MVPILKSTEERCYLAFYCQYMCYVQKASDEALIILSIQEDNHASQIIVDLFIHVRSILLIGKI